VQKGRGDGVEPDPTGVRVCLPVAAARGADAPALFRLAEGHPCNFILFWG